MELEKLAPGNTKRVRATGVGSFVKFLKNVYVRVCIERDGSGKCFVSAMDKFNFWYGMYLSFNESKKRKPLT
ncbi:Hypothetical protein PHPALM_11675 [Phytophthora palmivora]|uniref:Uncharacterized protein n=1 Tax=Phytophthora palmivora TaxID=4796 RepID=A0A2P4Y1P4_9STRA|nr:Hypothetical protein PHPALM_11675 [Phytophthora palmivora]